MPRSVRVVLSFVLLALPLGVLAAAGGVTALRQLDQDREAGVERTLGAVSALVAESTDTLRREAVLLSRDPAIVEGAAKGDWAAVVRWASPRLLAVTREGVADLLVVRDGRGAPLVQVPAVPPPVLPELPAVADSLVTLRLVNGRPYFLAIASIANPSIAEEAGRISAGVIILGRRFDTLARALDTLPSSPGVLFLAGDRALARTRADLPTEGWTQAGRAGRITVGHEVFALRPLGALAARVSGGALWAVVPETEFHAAQRRLWLWLIALAVAGAGILAAGVWIVARYLGCPLPARGRRGEDAAARRGELERRNRELEALNAIAISIGRGAGLVATLEETLEVLRGVAHIDVAAIYRLPAEGSRLVMIAQRGLTEGDADQVRERPLEGSHVGEAARSGRLHVAHLDTSPPTESRLREMAVRRGHRTQVSLPIPVEGRTWGVMAVLSPEARGFAAEEITTLEAVARQVGLAVERAQLQDTASARLRRLAAQREIERHILEQLDLERLLVVVAGSALRLIGGDLSVVYLREGDLLRPRAWSEVGDWIRDVQIPVGSGVVGAAVATGQGAVVNDYPSSPLALPAFREMTARLLAQPLSLGGRIAGVMVISRRPGSPPFTEEDLSALADFATQAVVAMENARLFAEAKQSAAEYQALFEVGGLLSSTLEVEGVLDMIVERCRALMGVAGAGIFKLDAATGDLIYARGVGFSPQFLASLRVRVGEGTTGKAVRDRAPVWSRDLLSDPAITLSEETRALVAREGYRAVLSAPILSKGDVYGALAAYWWEPHLPTSSEVALMQALASQAAIAVENARLYAETNRRLEETRALLEVAEILNSTLDPKQLLKRVAIKIAQVCRVDRCSIERWDGDRVIPLMSQFADGRRDKTLWDAFIGMPSYAPRAVPAHAQAIETRRPVIIADATATDLIPRQWIETFGHKSFLAVPLIRQDVVIGLMTLDYTERVTPFEPWQVNLATAIGAQLALSIENARLYAEAQERLKETTTLLAVGRVLSEPGPPVEVMRRVAREVAQAFGADTVGVHMLDPRKERLVPVAGYRVPKHLVEVFLHQPFVLEHFRALEGAWVERRAIWSSDVGSDPRFDRAAFETVGPLSVLLAPTPVRGESVGALSLVWWRRGREFRPAEIRLIEGVAAQVGLAMENAELARQTQLKLEETESLLSVSRTLASTLDLETLPRQLLRHVVRTLNADSAGIWMLDESGEWLEPLVGYHIPPSMLEAARGLRLSVVRYPFYAEAAQSRRSVVSTDVMHDERISRELRDVAPHRTQLFAPIIAKDRMVGGFAAVWWDTRREFSASELQMMEAISSQAGVALENARLFRDNQRRVEELSVLHELSRAVTGQLDQAGLLETIHQQMARLLDVRHMVILLHDEARGELDVVLRVNDGVRRDGTLHSYPRRAAGLSGVVLDIGRAIRTDDYPGECARRGVQPVPESVDLPHWLGVPMTAANRILGVLALRSPDRAFTESDERLLANIGDLAALALRSARLYEERARAHAELAAAQDQLIRTEKLRAMGEMASGVAHDFNNVLASIVGRAQLLLSRVEDPKLRQWIQVIERAAMDGARTVRQLQDFTRVRRDHPVVAVDVNQVIQQTLDGTESSWRQEPRSRGVEIEVTTSLAVPLPKISGDPADLREALTNLILNALDAMPRGGRLRLATAVVGGRVEITVADTGVGIAEGIRDKIFDPFFTTKGPRGTGLGLSMTYGILSRHGARVTVESEEGRGATFHLSFPVAKGQEDPRGTALSPAVSSAPLRCLVVDDEETVADVLSDMLVSEGHKAAVVTRGADVVGRLRSEPFDLVMTDLAMPGMTGWEVARAVKGVAPAVRVILVSGFGVEVSAEDLRAHGVDLVLAKPIRLQDLAGALAAVRPVADG